MNEEKSLQELEKDYDKTIKDLKNMSTKQLKYLVNEKRDILDSMDYALVIQKANGSLSTAINVDKKLGERCLEDFQDKCFWDSLLDKGIFDKQTLIDFIGVLDECKELLVSDEI